jgi:ParB family transcriptional regulator, chromosome partitioning protein
MNQPRKALGKGLEAIFATIGTEVVNQKTGSDQHEIEIARIEPNPFQPRRDFNAQEIEELAASIAEKGLLQPVLLRRHQGAFQIIAGERRFRAFKHLGRTRIPALVRDQVSDRDMAELAIIENVQRVQLGPIEEALAYERLNNELGLIHEEIARKVGKSRTAISNTTRLLKLEAEVKDLLQQGKLTAGHGRALIGLEPKQQIALARKIAHEGLNVRDAEAGKKTPATKGKAAGQGSPTDPNTRALIDRLRTALGTQVTLKGKPAKGIIEVHYLGKEDLNRLVQLFEVGAERFSEV